MRIPQRLNAILDRTSGTAQIILLVLPLAVAAATAPWIPALATFALGVGIGGFAVHVRLSAKVARLRAEADDLLRENGTLRHEKTLIAKTAVASESVLTQKLPSISYQNDT